VTSFRDRHGTERLRFRRQGYPSGYFKASIGSEAFREEYARFNCQLTIKEAAARARDERILPGSVADLRRRYYAVPDTLGPTPTTQQKIMSVLDRGFFNGREARPLKRIGFDHVDAIIAERKKRFKNPETGRWEGGVESARKLRKELVRLFAFAEKKGMIAKSPMHHVALVKVPASEKSKGFHSWSEEDIETYRASHPLGSSARLAMELILWTDQRGIDSMHLGRQHMKNGRFEITQTKTGKVLSIPIAPQLLETLIAMRPKADAPAFLLNELGRPFSRKGFGNKFRQWCDEAGLIQCSAHGLRKATLRRMAELKMPNKSMKSLSGHSKDDEITKYTEAADQASLARDAIEQLSVWEAAPPEERDDPMAKAAIEAFQALDRRTDV
jgi:integrase